MTHEDLKLHAAARAVQEINSGMVVGLGTGSTASHAIQLSAPRLRQGELSHIVCIPTSEATARLAQTEGIQLWPHVRPSRSSPACFRPPEQDHL